MNALLFECPNTGHFIDAGIEINYASLRKVQPVTVRLLCPRCDHSHDWELSDGWCESASNLDSRGSKLDAGSQPGNLTGRFPRAARGTWGRRAGLIVGDTRSKSVVSAPKHAIQSDAAAGSDLQTKFVRYRRDAQSRNSRAAL